MEHTLTLITQYVSPTLVYSIHFACIWRAYCECMLDRLVLVDRTLDIGLLVYAYKEVTKNISGQFVEKWSKIEKWSLANLIRRAKLPVGIVQICDRIETSSGDKDT